MAKMESKFGTKIVSSASEPILKNVILGILYTKEHGMTASVLLQEIISNGIKLEYNGLLYKSLQVLVRSGKIESLYSPQKQNMVYKITE